MNATRPPRPLRLALLTSRGGGHCMHIAEQIAAGGIRGIELAAVITENPQASVIEKCRQRGLPVRLLPWPGVARRGEHEQSVLDLLAALDADLVGLVGYLRLVGPGFVAAWRGRLFNLHPSLLPAYPGLDAIARACAAGEQRFGATVHWVDEGCDTGEIIVQRGLQRAPQDDDDAIAARVHRLEAELLTETLQRLATSLAPRPRQAALPA
jgi:phosphoribosylglycinamide formyltransferase 1